MTASPLFNPKRIPADRPGWWKQGDCHLEFEPEYPNADTFVERHPTGYLYLNWDYRWQGYFCTWDVYPTHHGLVGKFPEDNREYAMIAVENAVAQLSLF